MRTLTAAALSALMLLSFGGPALAASPPANDEMAQATTIGSIPFSATPDLSAATLEPGENADCLFVSARSVWYRYVVPARQILQVEIASSDPDAGVRIYYEYSGSPPILGNCVALQFSPFTLMVAPVTTLWFQVTTNTGTLATLSITSLPLLTMSATIDPTATYDAKAGTVTATGTITCNLEASSAGVFVVLYQRQGRSVAVSQGWAFPTCGPSTSRWTATLYGAVKAGGASAEWHADANVSGPPDQAATFSGPTTTISVKKRG